MATDITLPKLGENVESADVVRILVKPGDAIAKDQPVLELETNKASMELPSPLAGTVRDVRVKEGEQARIGQILFVVDPAGPETAPAAPASGAGKAEPAPEPAAKAAAAPEPAPPAPPKQEPAAKPAPPAAGDSTPAPAEPAPAKPQPDARASSVPAAPSVRRFAREIGIDIAGVAGSGPHGRVSVDDVKRHARDLLTARSAAAPAPTLPDFSAWGAIRREPMSHIRRATAQHLSWCWSQVAHVTQFDRADITKLEALRARYAPRAEAAGGKLTMAVMVVKATAAALRRFPKFNASIDMAAHQVIFKDYVNIGIAVATERGLLVPVLRDVDRKNMVQIAAEVSALAERTRTGRVSLAELQGGTFTVTNLGSIGGTHFTPIVNFPEVAILGMGRACTEAGFENGQVTPRTLLPLSLSYDHRLIDGADGARFLRWIVEAIEEPLVLSLEG